MQLKINSSFTSDFITSTILEECIKVIFFNFALFVRVCVHVCMLISLKKKIPLRTLFSKVLSSLPVMSTLSVPQNWTTVLWNWQWRTRQACFLPLRHKWEWFWLICLLWTPPVQSPSGKFLFCIFTSCRLCGWLECLLWKTLNT